MARPFIVVTPAQAKQLLGKVTYTVVVSKKVPVHDREWERRVLAYDPTAGDKDDGGVKVLNQRVVVARASGPCWLCGEAIKVGTRILTEVSVLDGLEIKRSRTCHACCEAMAKSWDDNGDAIEVRIARAQRRRR